MLIHNIKIGIKGNYKYRRLLIYGAMAAGELI